jgi:hypothetical protein
LIGQTTLPALKTNMTQANALALAELLQRSYRAGAVEVQETLRDTLGLEHWLHERTRRNMD